MIVKLKLSDLGWTGRRWSCNLDDGEGKKKGSGNKKQILRSKHIYSESEDEILVSKSATTIIDTLFLDLEKKCEKE